MNRKSNIKFTAALLALLLTLSLAGCSSREPEPVSEPDEVLSDPTLGSVYLNPLEAPDNVGFPQIPSQSHKIQEMYQINNDVVGWIEIPNTTLDDVVVYKDDRDTAGGPNSYYLRKDINENYLFDGIYYADFQCAFDGTADGLVQNTVIYGHSMDDNINGTLLSQLKKYDIDLNPDAEEFARENPYIFFSVEGEDLAWEIFAVFNATTALYYNNPIPTAEEFTMMMEECRARSMYDYDIDVSGDDKILTLSTCTYKIDSRYPNDYRYVIMAKLVDSDEPLKQQATFAVNSNPKAP